jgi:hypothetical protein
VRRSVRRRPPFVGGEEARRGGPSFASARTPRADTALGPVDEAPRGDRRSGRRGAARRPPLARGDEAPSRDHRSPGRRGAARRASLAGATRRGAEAAVRWREGRRGERRSPGATRCGAETAVGLDDEARGGEDVRGRCGASGELPFAGATRRGDGRSPGAARRLAVRPAEGRGAEPRRSPGTRRREAETSFAGATRRRAVITVGRARRRGAETAVRSDDEARRGSRRSPARGGDRSPGRRSASRTPPFDGARGRARGTRCLVNAA